MINEVCPKREIIDTVMKEVVVPILKQFELDIGKVSYKCSVYVGDNEEISIILDLSDAITVTDLFQPIRMRFRTIFKPNKLRFHIESIFSKELSPKGTGFSGFNTDGSINLEDLSIKKSAWIVYYNVWDWKEW